MASLEKRVGFVGLFARSALVLAVALQPLAGIAWTGPGDDDGGVFKPSVQQACANGRSGNVMMFAGTTAEGCDLVGWFDHFECNGNGGRYTHTSSVRIRQADCNPNPDIFNG